MDDGAGMDPAASKSGRSTPRASSGLYGLGFLGALVYQLQAATSFWDGCLGVLQAIFWPAFLVYDALDFLGS